MDKYDLVVFQPISSQLYNLLAGGWVAFGTILTGEYFQDYPSQIFVKCYTFLYFSRKSLM
jgi:hypothetical protein